jgi:hypothetical protein
MHTDGGSCPNCQELVEHFFYRSLRPINYLAQPFGHKIPAAPGTIMQPVAIELPSDRCLDRFHREERPMFGSDNWRGRTKWCHVLAING